MSRKILNAMVVFLAVLLISVPAWSSTPSAVNTADSLINLTTEVVPAANNIFKTEIILAKGGNGGGGGNGGQGGNGNGHGGGGQGGHGNGECDGTGEGPGPGDGDGPGPGPGAGLGSGDGSDGNR